MQGNIARWLKKEGDKVTPGEVLCEVETVRHSPVCWLYSSSSLYFIYNFIYYVKDKATVELECMEDGYLAKIIKGDGSKEIKVGEVLISRNIMHIFIFF